jgi:hypothetical protein
MLRSRLNYGTADSLKESRNKKHDKNVQGKTGLHQRGIFSMFTYSLICFVTPHSQARLHGVQSLVTAGTKISTPLPKNSHSPPSPTNKRGFLIMRHTTEKKKLYGDRVDNIVTLSGLFTHIYSKCRYVNVIQQCSVHISTGNCKQRQSCPCPSHEGLWGLGVPLHKF